MRDEEQKDGVRSTKLWIERGETRRTTQKLTWMSEKGESQPSGVEDEDGDDAIKELNARVIC